MLGEFQNARGSDEVARAIATILETGRDLVVLGRAMEVEAGETPFTATAEELTQQAVVFRAHAEAALSLVSAVLERAGKLAALAAARDAVERHREAPDVVA